MRVIRTASAIARRAGHTGRTASVPTATELVNGVPRIALTAETNEPSGCTVIPWTCSSTNTLRFCGIIELDPTRPSGIVRNPNSWPDHNSRSSATRSSVVASDVMAASRYRMAVRLATASREFTTGASKPSSSAVRAASIGTVVPPTAPAPSGQVAIAVPACRRGSRSRPTAAATPRR